MKKTAKKKKTKKAEKLSRGRVYVSASFNNTLVNVTDESGNTIGWASAGSQGFKGTRKSTPFAATTAIDKLVRKVKDEVNLSEVEVYIKGPGAGRDAALRAIKAAGVKISLIADVTPIPHNGPRPRKKRRV